MAAACEADKCKLTKCEVYQFRVHLNQKSMYTHIPVGGSVRITALGSWERVKTAPNPGATKPNRRAEDRNGNGE